MRRMRLERRVSNVKILSETLFRKESSISLMPYHSPVIIASSPPNVESRPSVMSIMKKSSDQNQLNFMVPGEKQFLLESYRIIMTLIRSSNLEPL